MLSQNLSNNEVPSAAECRIECTDSLSALLLTLGSFLIVFGPLSGTLRLWTTDGLVISPAGSMTALAGLLMAIGGTILTTVTKRRFTISPTGLVIALTIFLLSDYITREYSLLKGPEIRGEIILFSLLAWAALHTDRIKGFMISSAILAPLFLVWCFFDAAHGRFIFSDDHSVVLYRLQLLKDNFPFIPFYNPMWNAGLDARDFFATGILNLFLLGAPLIYFFELSKIYNLLIAFVLFILAPFLAWLSAYLDENEKPIPELSALLTLATSLFWYRWCLKYGSMGFVTATLFVALNVVLSRKFIDREDTLNPWESVIFIASVSLMLLWSLTGIIFLPIALISILSMKRILKKQFTKKIIFWILALNLPWIVLFLSVSRVSHFVKLKAPTVQQSDDTADNATPQNSFTKNNVKGRSKEISATLVLKSVRDNASPLNPLLFIFSVPGLFLLRKQSSQIIFATTGAWLLFLGLIVSAYKPQLELDRMLIICGFLMTTPAAVGCVKTIAFIKEKKFLMPLASLIPGVALASIISVGGIIYNRSPEKYTHADDVFFDLSRDLKNNVGDGRGVFVGFVLHELNSGHLAPLMHESEKPLVASTLFHNVWDYAELMPRDYQLKGDAGKDEFFDLMNATVLIAHDKQWREYLIDHPEKYEFISRQGVFNLFRRKNYTSNYFLKGSGELINQDSNSVTVRVKEPNSVLKFNYFPFLQSSSCTLEPHPLEGDLNFISLKDCNPGDVVTIRGKVGFSRIFGGSNG